MSNVKKAVIYARVSTEEQANEGFSIQAQLSELYRQAELLNLEVIKEYIDEGVSGKSIVGRPEMKKLLADARQRKFDIVLVYKLDRVSRKLKDALEISDELEHNNVQLMSLQENFDTTTPMGKMVFQMISSFAELERNTIVGRVKMGMTERAKQGKWNGGLCLGYSSINKQLVINEQEALIVKEVFNLAEQGLGLKAIARRINENGYKTKRGRLFSTNGIKQILDNPMYIGKIRFNQVENWNEKRRRGKNENFILADGEHEPIITQEQWDKVQNIRQKRSVKPSRSLEPYILSGLLKCPICGHGMVPSRSKGAAGQTYRYYTCGQYHNKGKEACRPNSIRADKAEQHVFEELSRIVSHPSALKKIIAETNKQRSHSMEPIQEEIKLLKSKINKIAGHIDKLMNALLDEELPQEIVKPKLVSSQEQKKQLEERLEALNTELTEADTSPIDYDSVQRLLGDFQLLLSRVEPEEQKILLRSIIKDIQVSLEAPRGIGRHITKINLFFDFTIDAMEDSYELLQKIYPDLEQQLYTWSTSSISYGKYKRDMLESLNSLPLFMIRFPSINPVSPVYLFE
jgi:site-specific DNA recombinase